MSAQSRQTHRFGACLGACFIAGVMGLSCFSQSFSLDWHTLAGGGGASSGGEFTVLGTIGQHDAHGTISGGEYSVAGGFWSAFALVTSPGAPTLFVGRGGTVVSLFWQNVPGWTLQQSTDLASSGGWSTASNVFSVNGTNYVNFTAASGSLFLRLRGPQ